jgi:drug/metabolite transporter (DMT)-like permease
MKPGKADLALVANTVIWGSTFVLVKAALQDVSPILFLALRFSLAALILTLIYRAKMNRKSIVPGIFAGFLLFGGYAFQTLGLQWTTPSKSAFLTGLSIPMVPLIGSLVYRKGPRPVELAGVLMASAGMALMTLQGDDLHVGRGDLLSFFCAIAFAGHIVALAHYSPRFSFETITVVQIATAAALALGSFWWLEVPLLRIGPKVLMAIAVTGVLATALAFTIQTWAQQYTTAARTALIYTLEPVCAWATSYWFTGEILSRRGIGGAVLILSGILLVEMKRANVAQHLSISAANPEI